MLEENERIQSKIQLREWLDYEMSRYGTTSYIARMFHIGERAILCRHQILLRKTEYYVNTGKKIRALIYRIALRKLQNNYAIHIPLNCCGKGLKIMHVGPILINGDATIGNDCIFHINTAIVAGGKDNGVPTVGSGVVISVGAVLVGSIYIAPNVVVGANAVVTKDIPIPNIAVAGIPAKKISDNGRLTWIGQS